MSTLVHALMVPQLAQACCDRFISNGVHNYDLKRLRLVCKGVREILQKELHSYTMLLGYYTKPDANTVVDFLKSIDLLRLKVVFPKMTTGEQGLVKAFVDVARVWTC